MKYGISMTLPTSYWYLQHFDLKNIAPSVDWFNFMTYDRKRAHHSFQEVSDPSWANRTKFTECGMLLPYF
jgi:GH18 family chitinase